MISRGAADASRPTDETIARQSASGRHPSWSALRWLFVFRLILLVGLILLFAPDGLGPEITAAQAAFAWRLLILYAGLVLASGIALFARWPGANRQAYLAIYVDIFVLTLLMHTAGGVLSGLGMLIAPVVAAGTLLMQGRLALLFASFATLAVLAEQLYRELPGLPDTAAYPQTGLLGATFFAVALLSYVLSRRIREVEAIAARRTLDLANLTQLNAYVIEHLGTGVLVVDSQRRVRLINKTALDLLGVAGISRPVPLSTLSAELAAWLDDNEMLDPSRAIQVLRLGERSLRVSTLPIGDGGEAGRLIDLRDDQALTREARQHKLAALGTLTASIAHNIRNPLSAVTHASELLAEGQELGADDRQLLEIIRRNCLRIDEIVRSVLQLSLRDKVEPVSTDLDRWLRELVAELRETHGLSEADCWLDLPSVAVRVEVDPRHLRQIIANLVENALAHAGRGDRPVRVGIRLRLAPLTGERPLIEVCDDGKGIDGGIVRDIFNPFFTTSSRGTGLGLYIARELAETNGIELTYARTEPSGSCFRMVFNRWG
jgi:two-component system sensor histidine kinase PilS (NtrC family)